MKTAPVPEFVRRVRVGSHTEFIGRWNPETKVCDVSPTYKKGYARQTIEEYETVFDDCLHGIDWLMEHYQDKFDEPTIDIVVSDKHIHFNGNYKKGVIRDFMADYTTTIRSGRKNVKIDVGEADRV